VTAAERVPAARWILRGLLLFVLAFANLHDIWSPDVVPNTLFAWTLLREGNVDYDEFATDPLALRKVGGALLIPRDTYFFRPCGEASLRAQETLVLRPAPATEFGASPRGLGPRPPDPGERVCSIFPPGISLLALPVLTPLVAAGVSPADGGTVVRAGHLAAALMETLAVLLLWSVMRRFVSARWALALVLLYWLGTSVRTISAQALWQHPGVHLSIALALWLVLQERVSIRREFIAGLVMGLGVTVRQTTAIVALGIARLPWPRVAVVRPLAPIAFALGVALGVLPLLAYNALAFGSPFEQGYGDKPFYLQTLWPGLYGLLLSPSRGIFIYEPWILAGLAAFVLAWRRPGLVALRLRGLSVAWILLLVTYANYLEWWGGRVFGPRFLDDLAPVIVVAIAWGISQGVLSRTWSRVAFTAAAAWSLFLFNAAALVYDPNSWDTIPTNVNFDPARLFSWSDPQWLAVLSSLGSADARVLAATLLSGLLVALLVRVELRRL